MAASTRITWTWDPNREDHYYVTADPSGNYTYHYAKGETPPVDSHNRNDSANSLTVPEPVIKGTPGLTETLDSSYRVRPGAERYNFFKIGKVFAMLHIQAASEDALRSINDNISLVKYNERAFSQIRRFVIVAVRRGFVYACPILTYSKRGTLKHGCVPSEHSVVYLSGATPTMFQGEYERGLVKQPICIRPVDSSVQMHPASRLHYGKVYPVEMNVKVKDIGDVDPEYLTLLLHYYKDEDTPSVPQPYQDQAPQEQSAQAQDPQTNYTHSSYPPQSQLQNSQSYQAPSYQVPSYQASSYQAPYYQAPSYQAQPRQAQSYQTQAQHAQQQQTQNYSEQSYQRQNFQTPNYQYQNPQSGYY